MLAAALSASVSFPAPFLIPTVAFFAIVHLSLFSKMPVFAIYKPPAVL